jgi:hypothetical protein
MAKTRTPDTQDGSDQVAETATTIEAMLRNTIETQPYMAVAVALAAGWFFGRMHRPF